MIEGLDEVPAKEALVIGWLCDLPIAWMALVVFDIGVRYYE